MWNGFAFRDDDVIVSTYAKSGTTWTQQIVGQLNFDGADDVNVPELSPWVDLRFPPREVKLPAIEAQSNRRSLKGARAGGTWAGLCGLAGGRTRRLIVPKFTHAAGAVSGPAVFIGPGVSQRAVSPLAVSRNCHIASIFREAWK